MIEARRVAADAPPHGEYGPMMPVGSGWLDAAVRRLARMGWGVMRADRQVGVAVVVGTLTVTVRRLTDDGAWWRTSALDCWEASAGAVSCSDGCPVAAVQGLLDAIAADAVFLAIWSLEPWPPRTFPTGAALNAWRSHTAARVDRERERLRAEGWTEALPLVWARRWGRRGSVQVATIREAVTDIGTLRMESEAVRAVIAAALGPA